MLCDGNEVARLSSPGNSVGHSTSIAIQDKDPNEIQPRCCYDETGCSEGCSGGDHWCSASGERCERCGGVLYRCSESWSSLLIIAPGEVVPENIPDGKAFQCCYGNNGCGSCDKEESWCAQSADKCEGCSGKLTLCDTHAANISLPYLGDEFQCCFGEKCGEECLNSTHWCSRSADRCLSCQGLLTNLTNCTGETISEDPFRCCYTGDGCDDSCNEPMEYCSESADRCASDECGRGEFLQCERPPEGAVRDGMVELRLDLLDEDAASFATSTKDVACSIFLWLPFCYMSFRL